MNMKLKKSLLGLSFGLAVVAATPAYSGQFYFFEDDDLEWALRPVDVNGVITYQEITSGNLGAGDVLYSILEFPTFEINGVNALPTGHEMTGVSAIEVESVVGTSYNFKPWKPFEDNYGVGATIAMFLNDLTTDVDLVGGNSFELSCTTLAGCITQTTEGSLFQVDGLTGDGDEFWNGLATTTDLAEIKAGAFNTPFVIYDAALGNLFNAWGPVGFIDPLTGLECADTGANDGTGCVQFLLSGSVYGGGGLADTNIVARSDIQGGKYVGVPEPVTMALLGIGLLGFGASRRRI